MGLLRTPDASVPDNYPGDLVKAIKLNGGTPGKLPSYASVDMNSCVELSAVGTAGGALRLRTVSADIRNRGSLVRESQGKRQGRGQSNRLPDFTPPPTGRAYTLAT